MVALITGILIETALRVLGFTQMVLYEADPETGYRLKPDQRVEVLGNEIVINRWGTRDARGLDTKPGFRILVLGDSVTWGGLRQPQEKLFTAVLERELRQATHQEVEVINAGVNGYSVQQMTSLYREHLSGLSPDLVLVCAIPRDFTRPPRVRLTGHSVAFPLRRPRAAIAAALAAVRLQMHERWAWGWLTPPLSAQPLEALPESECVNANVDALIALAGDAGPGRFLVVFAPWLPTPPNQPLPPEVLDVIRAERVPTVDLNETGAVTKNLFSDHIHLSPEGHEWVGARLADAIRDMGIL